MYISGWISLVVISLWVSLLAFLWALRSGQFMEQERARYLPLDDGFVPPPVKDPAKPTAGAYVLLLVATVALLFILAPVAMSLYR